MTLQRHFLLTLLFLVVTCSHTSSQISFSTNWGSGKRSSVLGPGLEPGDSDQSSWDSAKRPNIFAPRDSESINWGSGKLIGLFGARDSEANCFSRIEYNMLKDLVEIVKVGEVCNRIRQRGRGVNLTLQWICGCMDTIG